MPFSHIALSEYQARRAQVAQQIGGDAIAIFFAAPTTHRSNDTEYAYRQNSDFYYLTGFKETDAVLVLAPGTDTPVILFNQIKDTTVEQWTGARIGQAAALAQYGVDVAYPISELEEKLPTILANKKAIYYPMAERDHDAKVMQWITQARDKTRRMSLPDLFSVQKITAAMRLIKSSAEIKLMQKSAHISAQAHCKAMQTCRPGMMEYQLASEYVYHFMQEGALDVAYLPIVGGGKNACVLHYIANTEALRAGDLVLIDAGSEYHYYCADVTRTFPVNGKFSAAQRDLYDVVLNAYLAGLTHMKPGSDWTCVQTAVAEVLTQGLVSLNILTGDLGDLLERKAYQKFFMHGPGHWLGLDVHDVGNYKENENPRKFEFNMVLTLEPGIYIAEDESVDKKWWNTGIRIEDDILITSTGHTVLSNAAPILPEDIEQLMK